MERDIFAVTLAMPPMPPADKFAAIVLFASVPSVALVAERSKLVVQLSVFQLLPQWDQGSTELKEAKT